MLILTDLHFTLCFFLCILMIFVQELNTLHMIFLQEFNTLHIQNEQAEKPLLFFPSGEQISLPEIVLPLAVDFRLVIVRC